MNSGATMPETKLLEIIVKTIIEENPDATPEQIERAITNVATDIKILIINAIETQTPTSLSGLDLPSFEQIRLRCKMDKERAKRSVLKIRNERKQESLSRYAMISEIEAWQQHFTDMDDAQGANFLKERRAIIDQSFSALQGALSEIDIDLSTKVINDEKSDQRTNRMLDEMGDYANEK
jgi:hypothetical protein